jgi:hypothetical protein
MVPRHLPQYNNWSTDVGPARINPLRISGANWIDASGICFCNLYLAKNDKIADSSATTVYLYQNVGVK